MCIIGIVVSNKIVIFMYWNIEKNGEIGIFWKNNTL